MFMYVFILNLSKTKQNKLSPPSYILEVRYKPKKVTQFTFRKKVEKQFIDIRRNLVQPFCTVQSQKWKSPYDLYIWRGFF